METTPFEIPEADRPPLPPCPHGWYGFCRSCKPTYRSKGYDPREAALIGAEAR